MTDNYIINSVVMIHAFNNTSESTGTAFFIEYKNNKFLVTNKHIINEKNTLLLKMRGIDRKTKQKYTSISINICIDNQSLYVDDKYDLCFFNVEKIIEEYDVNNIEIEHTFIHITDDVMKYKDIENIVICGFPCKFIDEVNNKPIVLSGITSTSLNTDYNGKKFFLTNTHGYKGASGSPVFRKMDNEYDLVGIMYGNKPVYKADELESEIPDKFKVLYEQTASSNINANIKVEVLIQALKNYNAINTK